MKQKLYGFLMRKSQDDPLLLQKLFLVLGAIAGFLLGLFISDKADKFEQTYLEEENELTSSD